ncbi:CRISPR-associated endonuclease Cas1 [Anabaena cylindrica FACHB-243]|uniref:CRISPR-associated endonuclease Cas1 n=1 Tax=Anabaena cylindrica (strain ATCC 27899 / PCC 7122) TaxID=272123 RepID=K9ZR74_ANACC|nr:MULTISPECIES: CRISPR-associated endonuclease Cas1 [Anabaena]AFZ61062.1 CRISPR-associated protein Cas1 [Anabaena cylindrica PCC 7122]MBD2421809.1 CRISPR-associated endonuclease Cas1 [Anabaena cylindrica FACHB-243]MBY5284593.1 CRISPR-associated endonuclease Cas1 [Anabaena sp. CCAP 1446/1C]MBY5306420.1 CRISPR-associated endonuclease Cas1 [Anabaena sp. CCAP 1446/1C]MCM2408066.1 CRISPR-associated endonuclease Cas1 [Anabaena sp. CCAP 1446/1C]
MSTIYITEQDANLQIQHHYLKVFHQQKQCVSLRISNVSQIILFGNITLPKEIIKVVVAHQIPVLYITPFGEIIGRLENTSQRQYKYLTCQRQWIRNRELKRATAESMIWAKLHNQHTFLQSWTRHHANYITQRALNYLTLLIDNLPIATFLNELREYSEEADKVYESAVTSIFSFYNVCSHINQKPINGFLNLGYQLLNQYIYTLLDSAGLHPNYAILSRNSDHELPLAWDLAAEFRAPIVDDCVLNFVRNFSHTNGNGKSQSRTILQRFLQHWEAQLRTFVIHPYAGEVSYRQCMDLQVREYIACLLGDAEYYRPLAFKHHPEEVKSQKIKVKREESEEVKSQKVKVLR